MVTGDREGKTILERTCEWAAALSLDDLPASVVSKLRLQVASVLSAAAAAPWHEPSRAVLRARAAPGRTLVIATGDRRAPLDAAFVNAAFAMSLDMDDYMLAGHTGYSAVLVPLAFARDLHTVLVAAAAANELMGRLSTSCLIGPVNGQISTYIHDAGAALALGKVLGLTADQLVSAVAIALFQPNLCLAPGFWDQGAKTVTASQPMEHGVRAAQLAQAGLTGPRDIIEHPLGFATFFAFARYPGLFDGLGRVWFSETLSYKRFPGTSYISAAVEGALRCTDGVPMTSDEVGGVEVVTTLLSSGVDSVGAAAIERSPYDANAINFSVRLSVALALLQGDLTPDMLRPERLAEKEGEVRAIARKVRVVHDWSQTLRLLDESPVGLAMLAHLTPGALARAASHIRMLGRASGAAGRNPVEIRGLLRDAPSLLRRLAAAKRRPVTALDFDPTTFHMLQSAHTTVRVRGEVRKAVIDVPVGACGRDPIETEGVVRWRLERSFGDRAGALWDVLGAPSTSVDDIYSIVDPSR